MASNWHSLPPRRIENAVTGPSFLAAATTSDWPDFRLQDIHRYFGCWSELDYSPFARYSFGYLSELVFTPSHSTQPKRALLQGTLRCEPPLKERAGLFNEGGEIQEWAPGSHHYRSLCHYCQEKVEEEFPHVSHWPNIHLPISLPPSLLHITQ